MDFGVVINYYFFLFNVVSHGYESNLIGVVNVFVIRTNDILFWKGFVNNFSKWISNHFYV